MRISDWSSDVCSSDLRLRGDRRAQKFAVLGGDVQRVLAQDRDHLEAERDAQVLEDAADLRLADLVVGLVVEVHLVDGAAGGDDEKLVHIVYPLTDRSEEHTSELQSLMRISYAGFCVNKKTNQIENKSKIRKK